MFAALWIRRVPTSYKSSRHLSRWLPQDCQQAVEKLWALFAQVACNLQFIYTYLILIKEKSVWIRAPRRARGEGKIFKDTGSPPHLQIHEALDIFRSPLCPPPEAQPREMTRNKSAFLCARIRTPSVVNTAPKPFCRTIFFTSKFSFRIVQNGSELFRMPFQTVQNDSELFRMKISRSKNSSANRLWGCV